MSGRFFTYLIIALRLFLKFYLHLTINLLKVVNSTLGAAVTGIAAEVVEVAALVVDPRIAAVVVEAVALLTSRLVKRASSSNRSSRAMIAGRSQSAQPDSMAGREDHPAVVAATEATTTAASAEAAAGATTAGGRRAAEATSTTQSWGPETSAWSRSCLGWATRESILTNTRIYPWRRRARMCPRTSHRSMMCS